MKSKRRCGEVDGGWADSVALFSVAALSFALFLILLLPLYEYMLLNDLFYSMPLIAAYWLSMLSSSVPDLLRVVR